jgi:DnaJ-class molecular chaperone
MSLHGARLAGPEGVRSRAAELIAQAHPDRGGDATTAADKIARLKMARDALVQHLQADQDDETLCDLCAGKGMVRGAGWSRHTCPKCTGTGVLI